MNFVVHSIMYSYYALRAMRLPFTTTVLILFAFIYDIHFCSFPELGFSVKVSTTKGSGHADYITAGFKSRQKHKHILFLGFEIYNNLYTLKVRKKYFHLKFSFCKWWWAAQSTSSRTDIRQTVGEWNTFIALITDKIWWILTMKKRNTNNHKTKYQQSQN